MISKVVLAHSSVVDSFHCLTDLGDADVRQHVHRHRLLPLVDLPMSENVGILADILAVRLD